MTLKRQGTELTLFQRLHGNETSSPLSMSEGLMLNVHEAVVRVKSASPPARISISTPQVGAGRGGNQEPACSWIQANRKGSTATPNRGAAPLCLCRPPAVKREPECDAHLPGHPHSPASLTGRKDDNSNNQRKRQVKSPHLAHKINYKALGDSPLFSVSSEREKAQLLAQALGHGKCSQSDN